MLMQGVMGVDMYNWSTSGPWINGPGDTQWKYKLDEGVLYIAFQSSCSKLDWFQNFMFWTKPYKRMNGVWFAHAGFVSKWKAVEDEIFDIVGESEAQKVIVSGFSQGAAIAQLCHESIRFHFPSKNCTCFAYASPRVFSMLGFRHVKKRLSGITLFERWHDIVCKLPSWIMLYRKTVKPVKIDKWWPLSLRLTEIHMNYEKYLKEQ
jgi:hypothetical protein